MRAVSGDWYSPNLHQRSRTAAAGGMCNITFRICLCDHPAWGLNTFTASPIYLGFPRYQSFLVPDLHYFYGHEYPSCQWDSNLCLNFKSNNKSFPQGSNLLYILHEALHYFLDLIFQNIYINDQRNGDKIIQPKAGAVSLG